MHQVRIAEPVQHGWRERVAARPAPSHTPDLDPAVSVAGGQFPAAPIIEDAVKRDNCNAVPGTQLMDGELFDEILDPADSRVELTNDVYNVEGVLFSHISLVCRSSGHASL
jgi:hypothetical protein